MISNKNLKNKIFLITGGTGSFGHAMVPRLLKGRCKEIRIFSRDEKKQNDMRIFYKNSSIKFYLGDVRDESTLTDAFKNVDYVFHAAALKQVPSCEFFPNEAVKTNILGTENVLNTSIKLGIRKIVCLSTDKAVYPINSMGVSKAMMEKIALSKSRNLKLEKTKICITRYGNVLASRGSVVPLFVSQIKSNSKVTVTDFEMTRFLMKMDEALDLVFFAFFHGENGDIFVKKSPSASIKILLKAVSEILNCKPEINRIGFRHGEKQHETLVSKEEMLRAIEYKNYYKIKIDNRDLNYENFFSKGKNFQISKIYQEFNSSNTILLNVKQTKELILPIVKNL